MANWAIRPYAATLADAHGILAVEQRTFNECPYTAAELRDRLAAPSQQVLVAEAAGQVVGFLAGLRTPGLRGARLEADLLAVDPAWQGQGIASALLVALRRSAGSVMELRGAVRPGNPASERAFAHAGFQPSSTIYDLMIYRILGIVPRSLPPWGGEIGPLAGPQEAAQLAGLAPAELPPAERIWAAGQEPGLTLLVARAGSNVAGALELLEVHTLLYSGLWLEACVAGEGRRRVMAALAAAAVEVAKVRQLDEVGALVPREQRARHRALIGEGFRLLDSYRAWTAAPLGGASA